MTALTRTSTPPTSRPLIAIPGRAAGRSPKILVDTTSAEPTDYRPLALALARLLLAQWEASHADAPAPDQEVSGHAPGHAPERKAA